MDKHKNDTISSKFVKKKEVEYENKVLEKNIQ